VLIQKKKYKCCKTLDTGGSINGVGMQLNAKCDVAIDEVIKELLYATALLNVPLSYFSFVTNIFIL
jgi:hypothetical protein